MVSIPHGPSNHFESMDPHVVAIWPQASQAWAPAAGVPMTKGSLVISRTMNLYEPLNVRGKSM
jgi:hypothetical protein